MMMMTMTAALLILMMVVVNACYCRQCTTRLLHACDGGIIGDDHYDCRLQLSFHSY